jgi:hypothetical protein
MGISQQRGKDSSQRRKGGSWNDVAKELREAGAGAQSGQNPCGSLGGPSAGTGRGHRAAGSMAEDMGVYGSSLLLCPFFQ